MSKFKLIAYFLLFATILSAQTTTNKIRGIVQDKQTKQTLVGASITINQSNLGAISDENGAFVIDNVPVGRVSLKCQFVGYEPFAIDDIILSSTKEVFLEIELKSGSIQVGEVVVSAAKNAFEAVNPLSVVSTRSFTAEETDRIAAGINDPGRVALSFPGVKQGPDETENAIIVRGNSPVGILWRVEGIDIPNPNHFALIGSSVGGVNVFSAQLLARSDFSSGGMAAEYGNAISGAFDMHFRKGNFQKREHRVKLGIIGLDFATEGPIQKGKASYLVNYRYSTLSVLNKLGFNLVGERVTNDFQDLSFNIALNHKNPKLKTTIFGIGGVSLEEYLPVDDPSKRKPNVFDNRNFQHKPAKMGAVGTTWTYLTDNNSYLKLVVALIGSDIRRENDTLGETNVAYRYNTERYKDRRISSSLTYNYKFSDKLSVKTGAIFHYIFFDFYKKNSPLKSQININDIDRRVSVEGEGQTSTNQVYAQGILKLTPQLTANVGLHFTRLAANNTSSLEPRLSLQYQIKANQRLSLALGLQGQMLPLMTYFFKDSVGQYINKNLEMLRSQHAVLAYHLFTENKMKISVETYFQKLRNVPVSPVANDNYWMLNNTNGYPTFKVVGDGKGLNYGIDLAIEKLFSNSYFILLTGSLFESTFQPFNQKTFNSRWASRFSSSMTFGKEFNLNKNKGRVLQIGGRFLFSGGARYTPLDPIQSQKTGTYIPLANAENEAQVPNYYRLDTRIQYRYNAKKLAGSISLDIQNALNHINATGVGYEASTNTTVVQYRGGGLIPVLAFQFDF